MGGFDIAPTRRALKSLLRVIARFCLRHSLRIQELEEQLKESLIEEAAQQCLERTGAVNVSRLSIMTGIHRKDVDRIFRDQNVREAPQSLAGRIIVEWQTNKRFSNKGRPRVLSITDEKRGFRALVNQVSAELNATTVLFELERVNAVERTKNGIKLVKQSYVPVGNIAAAFQLLGADTEDLVCAVEDNVLHRDDHPVPHLHVKTEFDRVCVDNLDEIREWLLEEGSAFQRRFRAHLSKFDCDHNQSLKKERCTARVVLGTFSRAQRAAKPELEL